MSTNFDVLIESDDYSVDMNSGLDTLKGASEVLRQVTTTFLEGEVPERLSKKNNVRTTLKKTFRGSFGQQFSIDVNDEDANKKLHKIGKSTLAELISYFIHESLYMESRALSEKAATILNNLEPELEKKLIEQLQKSALKHLHAISLHFNKDVKLRFRRNSTTQEVLATLNRTTYESLRPIKDRGLKKIVAGITRLNINTGNGRLLLDGEDETIAFGFLSYHHYANLNQDEKEKYSINLHMNNTRSENKKITTLTLLVKSISTKNGRVIKYIIEAISDA
jgi:plasmid maintenance system killer protein